jgi:DeoR/GlpR family transcriptional regulator of sugar metabolism
MAFVNAHARKRPPKSQRHNRIVEELRRAPTIRVNELSELLRVSTETVRRDLGELDRRGLINRTYGGAVLPISAEPALSERESLMVAERKRIATAAVGYVQINDILMLGGGATTLHFARQLAAKGGQFTVITHSFSIAMALSSNPLAKVLMLPGQYDGREGLIYGADTIEALMHFHANKAFLGASGLTEEGPSDATMTAGSIYGMMTRRASEVFVLADHSKFNRPSLMVYGVWGPQVTLVSDAAPDGPLMSACRLRGTGVIVAPETGEPASV